MRSSVVFQQRFYNGRAVVGAGLKPAPTKRATIFKPICHVKILVKHYTRFQASKPLAQLILGGAILLATGLCLAAPVKKSLDRTEDFVLFTGEQAPAVIGSETRDLHLYACGPSGLRAIPFQVDKRDQESRYVFPDEKLRDPARDGTRLDANDEMVFMVKDAGDQCPNLAWPEAAVKAEEIKLTDPNDSSAAWVYLFDRPGAKPPETQDYVSYRVENGQERIKTGQYEIGRNLAEVDLNFLRVQRPEGGWGPNLLNRTELNLQARLVNGAIPVQIPQQKIRCAVMGVIDGPVRVINDVVGYLKVESIGLDWSTETFPSYYYNGHITPVEAKIPFTLPKVFLELTFFWGFDFNENILGATFRDPANPRGIVLDGRPNPQLDTTRDNTYLVVNGPQGGIIYLVDYPPLLAQQMWRGTLVRESLARPDSRKDHSAHLLVGFQTLGQHSLPKGTYNYRLCYYYPVPISDPKIGEIVNLIEHPLQVTARPLNPPTKGH